MHDMQEPQEKLSVKLDPKPNSSNLGTVLLVVAVVVISSAGAYWFGKSQVSAPGNKVNGAVVERNDRAIVDLGQIITNLSDSDASHFVRANVQLEASDKKAASVLEQRKAELRNEALKVFRSKRYKELSGDGGMTLISKELSDRINKALGGTVVNGVYFLEFIVQ